MMIRDSGPPCIYMSFADLCFYDCDYNVAATCWSTCNCWRVLTPAPQPAGVPFVTSQFQ